MVDKVAVIGMGPGGLVAAIDLARKGISVDIFENRDLFTRPQVVHLEKDMIQYLAELGEKNNTRVKYRTTPDEGLVQTKDLQKFLKQVAEKENLPIQLHIRQKGKKQIISEIDFENGKISYHDKESGNYKLIVAADGARRTIGKSAAKQGFDPQIQLLEHQRPHQANATVHLEVTQPGLKELQGPRPHIELEPQQLQILRENGWKKPYLPEFHITHNQPKPPATVPNKWYFAGEIPDAFLLSRSDSPDQIAAKKQGIIEWGQLLLDLTRGIKPSQSEFVDTTQQELKNSKDKGMSPEQHKTYKKGKNALKLTSWPLVLQKCGKPIVDTGQSHLIMLGDAAMDANMHIGKGTSLAMRQGQKLAEVTTISEGVISIDSDPYVAKLEGMRAAAIANMKLKDAENLLMVKGQLGPHTIKAQKPWSEFITEIGTVAGLMTPLDNIKTSANNEDLIELLMHVNTVQVNLLPQSQQSNFNALKTQLEKDILSVIDVQSYSDIVDPQKGHMKETMNACIEAALKKCPPAQKAGLAKQFKNNPEEASAILLEIAFKGSPIIVDALKSETGLQELVGSKINEKVKIPSPAREKHKEKATQVQTTKSEEQPKDRPKAKKP